LLRELAQPAPEEAPLGLLAREVEGAPAGCQGLGLPSQAPAHVGARGARQVVVAEIAAREDGVVTCRAARPPATSSAERPRARFQAAGLPR
jgi:hypothetical protein